MGRASPYEGSQVDCVGGYLAAGDVDGIYSGHGAVTVYAVGACQWEREVRGMEKKITALVIEAHVEDIDSTKELLNDLETLLEKYDVTIDLKIYRSFQGSGTPI